MSDERAMARRVRPLAREVATLRARPFFDMTSAGVRVRRRDLEVALRDDGRFDRHDSVGISLTT